MKYKVLVYFIFSTLTTSLVSFAANNDSTHWTRWTEKCDALLPRAISQELLARMSVGLTSRASVSLANVEVGILIEIPQTERSEFFAKAAAIEESFKKSGMSLLTVAPKLDRQILILEGSFTDEKKLFKMIQLSHRAWLLNPAEEESLAAYSRLTTTARRSIANKSPQEENSVTRYQITIESKKKATQVYRKAVELFRLYDLTNQLEDLKSDARIKNLKFVIEINHARYRGLAISLAAIPGVKSVDLVQ